MILTGNRGMPGVEKLTPSVLRWTTLSMAGHKEGGKKNKRVRIISFIRDAFQSYLKRFVHH